MTSSAFGSWESVRCHLCDGGINESSPVLLEGLPLNKGQFGLEIHPVVCRCGLVYLNPRWSPEKYEKYYAYEYDEVYRLEIKPDYGVKGVVENMEEIWLRTTKSTGNFRPEKILDVGCASGYGLHYLQDKNKGASIYGIEASTSCLKTLRENGRVKVLDQDVSGSWSDNYEGYFDFIVMRHVVEHILDPVSVLAKMTKVLKPGGFIYLSCPDMMKPRLKLRDYPCWWEYYFRAVHPYYYTKETLGETLSLSGFSIRHSGEEKEEVWCLAEPGASVILKNPKRHALQMQILSRHLP